MITSAPKSLIILLVFVLLTGIVTVGCDSKQKPTSAWVNTDSLPGHAMEKYYPSYANQNKGSSAVVYLGDPNTPNVQFGPRDVSFSFRDLK